MTPLRPDRRPRRVGSGRFAADEIIVTLERLLVERPLDEVSVADILAAAGVARGTFYLWFPNKHAVVGQAFAQLISEITANAEVWFERGSLPPGDAVHGALDRLVATWTVHGPILRAAAETWRTHPEVGERWEPLFEELIDRVAAQIEREQAAGLSPDHLDAHTTARALVTMNERMLYDASTGRHAGLAIDDRLVDALTDIWVRVIYVDR